MSNQEKCPTCGTLLSRHGPDGNCPAHLLALARSVSIFSSVPQRTNDPVIIPSFGDYEKIEIIARGGMGVVCRARQTSLNRPVALKMIRAGEFATEAIRRFRSEAEAAARLDHPHIVPIYEIGEHGDFHYFCMKLVEGRDLARAVQSSPMAGQRRVAELMETIARAVHHAHQRGIIHRDLKPANILLDTDGQPHVTDFGIARVLEAEAGVLLASHVVGTPEFMAPEQACGQAEQITVATDVYSLGAILFVLLTGRPPIVQAHGERAQDFLHRIGAEAIQNPCSLNPAADPDLAAICLKCLEKTPAARYVSARALCDDLQRWRQDEPIEARPANGAKRAWKWARRSPTLAALTFICVVLVALGFVGLVWHSYRTQELNNGLESALLRIELQHVEDNFSSDNSSRAFAELTRLARQHPLNTVIAHRLVSAMAHRRFARPEFPALTNAASFTSAIFTPDGRWIITMSGESDAQVFDATNGVLHATYPGYGLYYDSLSISPDGNKVMTGLEDGTAIVWEPSTGKILARMVGHAGIVETTDFSADGRRAITGSRDGTARVWDTETGRPISPTLQHQRRIRHVRFSPEGRKVVTASDDETARTWDAQTGAAIGVPMRHGNRVDSAVFSPDGSRVLTASSDVKARIWDANTGRPMGSPMTHGGRIRMAEFSPDGKSVATASIDGTARLWNAFTGDPLTPPLRHRSQVRCLAFSPDGKQLLTGSYDTTSRLWDTRTGLPLGEPLPGSARLRSVAFDRTGQRLICATEDGRAQAWRITQTPPPVAIPHTQLVSHTRFSHDGTLLATASKAGEVRVWDTGLGNAEIGRFLHPAQIFSLQFDRNGTRVLTGSDDGNARLWEVKSGNLLSTFAHEKSKGVYSATFDAREKWVITCSDDKTARLWDLNRDGVLHQTLKHMAPVTDARFSPDATLVVTASDDGIARLWETQSGRLVSDALRHDSKLATAQFSSNGRWVLTASIDKTARIWDALHPSGIPAAVLQHNVGVRFAQFSPDDRMILTRCYDNIAYLWQQTPGGWAASPIYHDGEVLSCDFSRDGSNVVTTCSDGFCRIWDARSGLLQSEPFHHDMAVECAAFSPEGRRLVTASDNSAFLWKLPKVPMPLPDWFLELAGALAGSRLNDRNGMEKIPSDNFFKAKSSLAVSTADDDLTQWGRAFFELPNRPLQAQSR